jgi:hypothetical protein
VADAPPTLIEGAGFTAARIQPVNYEPVDGDWVFCIGSDLPGMERVVAVGELAGIQQDVDLTDVTKISYAVALRQTEGASAGARRGLEILYPVYFLATDTIKLKVDGGSEQTITFATTDNSLAEIVDRCNATLVGAVASADNGQLKFTSDTTGTGSSIEITGGTIYQKLGHTLGTTAGEHVTFRFVFEIDGIAYHEYQPAADDAIDYAARTANVYHLTGTKTLAWYLEAVA